jgi:predicted translin family RNA/ssDNA-binding protein
MKIFLATILSVIFTTSAFSCEIYDHADNRIKELTCEIHKLNQEISYNKSMDYFSGFLHGQRQAYIEVQTLIDDLYPN